MNLHGFLIILNVAEFLALFGCSGLLAARAWILPPEALEMPDLARSCRVALAWCLAVLMVAGIALLLVRTAEMGGHPIGSLLADLKTVVIETHFGHVWSLHLLTLLWLMLSMPAARHVPNMQMALLGMAMLTFTYSATSHASDGGDFTFAELNDWLHVVSTSVWGGGIFVTLLVVFPLLKKRHAVLARTAARLSDLSALALVLVLFSGISNALLRIHNWAELIETDYGRILLIKMTLVAIMVLIGGINRFVIVPHIRGNLTLWDVENAIWHLKITLALDAALLVTVLIAAGMLIQGMPPSKMHGMQTMPMDGKLTKTLNVWQKEFRLACKS